MCLFCGKVISYKQMQKRLHLIFFQWSMHLFSDNGGSINSTCASAFPVATGTRPCIPSVVSFGIRRWLTCYTLSETLYHWRKIEPLTMKVNFIYFWCVESESMIKNWFHNWTSELGCIWHIFGKLGYFWIIEIERNIFNFL